MLFLHKRVFGDKYDPIMVSCHYCFLKEGFVIADVADEEKEILPCHRRNPQFLQVTYRKGDIDIETKQAVDQRFYYLSLKINRKPYDTFLSIADYVNDGKVFDDENLIKKLSEFINSSLADFETREGGQGGKGGQGAIGGGKISV
ncbi:unnamed protein product [Rotaria sp. Silwood2]|nr:unnamed protein product [Rotaria sp. Silwood2]CAF4147056.1 unnamed protein product [Rotaria sp. Silwood2]CAF4229316.1 unnamed protein product [Rotaria sp. Silwood2]CAF4258962.1 unnamed protein product [Rotaria sp. Silwood2]CAF4346183.1 unnamed protein product [Rotaria sp. Silwood2]